VTNIGTNPTFGNGQLTVETFLLDYDGDLYGRELGLRFVQFLRPERRFPSVEELAAQIGRDVEQGRAVLAPWLEPAAPAEAS
jgi:riboflavin kinase/FMN adenylyltransferase